MASELSSGLLLYRRQGESGQVLLVHPSGNYNRKKPWSIPKGWPEPGESLEAAARRETWEETGIRFEGPLTPLGTVKYPKSGKVIHAFAGEGPADQEPRCASWEVDRAEYVGLEQARELLHPGAQPFLERLAALLHKS